MKRAKIWIGLLVLISVVALFLGLMATMVVAKSQVPPEYAGVKNPYPWDDIAVQAQGKKIYDKSCGACHGANGKNFPGSNFGTVEFSASLEAQPDYYFWAISEGGTKPGMPPYKSSLSEQERWQVLTYMWSMGKPAAPAPPTGGEAPKPAGNLTLTIDERSASPSRLILTASLKDSSGQPIAGEPVKFFLKKDFFVADWMELGEMSTDKDGVAVLQYFPSEEGPVQVMARQGDNEATGDWTVKNRSRSYHVDVGIRLPTPGPEVSTQLALGPAELGQSPPAGFRLPGGTLSWLLIFVGTIILVWTTYFRVLRQVVLIPAAGHEEGMSTKLIPLAGMIFVLVVGAVLAVVILRGPYTHLHLGP